MRFSAFVSMLLVALVVSTMPAVVQAEESNARPRLVIDKLELRYTKILPLPLDQDRLIVIQRDGSFAVIPVTLRLEAYDCRVLNVSETETTVKRTGSMYCYTLCSKDEKKPYAWSIWFPSACAHFRLMSDFSGKNYLAWVKSSRVCFTEVSEATEKFAQLDAYLSQRGKPQFRSVPIGALIPDARSWGVDAHHSDIHVISIEKSKDEKWIVQISGPESDQIYTVVSDDTAERGWRLLE